jgi:hypothetical protein
MIYIKTLQTEDGKEAIVYRHFFPFGNESGQYSLNKTAEELEQDGYLIEGPIPEAEPPEGKDAQGPFYDPESGDIYYEYVDHVPTPEEQAETDREQEIAVLQQKIASLEQAETDLQLALAEVYELVAGGGSNG